MRLAFGASCRPRPRARARIRHTGDGVLEHRSIGLMRYVGIAPRDPGLGISFNPFGIGSDGTREH